MASSTSFAADNSTNAVITCADFKELHSGYKKLLKIKPLIKIGIQKSYLKPHRIVDVHYTLVKSILKRIQIIQNNATIDESMKSRVIGMEIALILDETMFFNTQMKSNKLKKLKRTLDKFEKMAYKPEILYVFLNALSYAAQMSAVEAEQKPNFDSSIDWIKRAEMLFNYCEEIHQQDANGLILYDSNELFSKQFVMMPMADAFKQIESIHFRNLNLLATNYLQRHMSTAYLSIMQKILQRDQDMLVLGMKSLNWIQQLLKVIPITIELNRFQSARYYMEVAGQLLKNNLESNQFTMDEIQKCRTIHCEIAKIWVNYTLSIFQYSSKNGSNRKRPNDERKSMISADDTLSCKDDDELEGNFHFDGIQLECNEHHLQSNCIRHHMQAQELFMHCMPMIKCLMEACDLTASPVEYIALNYQLFELYAQMTNFSEQTEAEMNYLQFRFDAFIEMFNKVRMQSPHIFSVLEKDFLIDLNEMQIDMVEFNFKRINALMPTKIIDGPAGDADRATDPNDVLDVLTRIRCLNKRQS